MIIKEIKKDKFVEFSTKHILYNYFQTYNYSKLMQNYKYDIMYIGGFENNEIVGAALILYKTITPTVKYGYAPRGFLIDYSDNELVKNFTKGVKDFFSKKGFAFIKINPAIIYAKINIVSKKKEVIPQSKELISLMKELGYEKLRSNLYFESMLPRYNAIINLKNFSKSIINDKCYIKSHSIINKSLKLKKSSINGIDKFYEFIKDKTNKSLDYYKDLYKVFNIHEMIDLLFVEIDYRECLTIYLNKYQKFSIENEEINRRFNNDSSNLDLYNEKIDSDNKLSEIKHFIDLTNRKLQNDIKSEIIAGAMLVKQNNKVSLIISGNDSEFKNLNYKYFLYYNLINYYKKLGYTHLDLNGIAGNFSEKNPYKGLNDFKLSFSPDVYEYIGEFDLVINNRIYDSLWNNGKLKKEFMN